MHKFELLRSKWGIFASIIVLIALNATAHADLIQYDIVFYDQADFSVIGDFSGGFTYDDETGFVSSFLVDLDTYGSFFLADAVPASLLSLGDMSALAFIADLVVDFTFGDIGTSCTASCVSFFNTTNVFGIFENNQTFNDLYLSGFYQILPSNATSPVSVPEPSTLALMWLPLLVVLVARRKRLRAK